MRDRGFGGAIGKEKLGGGAVLVGGEGETVDFGEVGEKDFREDEWHSRSGPWLWSVIAHNLVACLSSARQSSQHNNTLTSSSRQGCCRTEKRFLLTKRDSSVRLCTKRLQSLVNCYCSVTNSEC